MTQRTYKDRECNVCHKDYTPTGPRQTTCAKCFGNTPTAVVAKKTAVKKTKPKKGNGVDVVSGLAADERAYYADQLVYSSTVLDDQTSAYLETGKMDIHQLLDVRQRLGVLILNGLREEK